MPETGAALAVGSDQLARVDWATGSPNNPMTDDQLSAKVSRLAGTRLDGLLDEPTAAAREALEASGLA